MMTRIRVKALLLLLTLCMCFSALASGIPASTLMEDELSNHPAVQPFFNKHLNTVTYYPQLPEEDLVAMGSAYLAPLIIFEDEKPVLLLNAIVASRNPGFSFERIEFDFTEEEISWDVKPYDASDDGFYADEVYLRVDEKLLGILMFIADHPNEELHVTFWGKGNLPLHFALTDNQIHTIQDYLKLYLGQGNMESISI